MAKLTADEIRLRGLLLAKNKDLLQLHRDLVMSGMMREDDFWETRTSLLENQDTLLKQRRPPSTANLLGIDIKPQADIQGDLKFVLTPALIQSIFDQNPILKRAYNEKVPTVVDEKAFWMQYFTSKFFKEGLTSSTNMADKPSPNGNILDEYYMELQREQEGDLALRRPTEKLPISIDIMATTEDHYHAADEDAQPSLSDAKAERTKTATIRKLNKLSSTVIESSGIGRLDERPDGMDELLNEPNNDDDYIPLQLNEYDIDRKRDVIIDESHIDKLREEWKNIGPCRPSLINYQAYSTLMQDHRIPIDTASSEARFTESDLTVVAQEAFQIYTQNMLELLRQFWSAYPPGSNAERQSKVTRMAGILESMLSKIDGWVRNSSSPKEAEFIKGAMTFIRKAAELAIDHAKPVIPTDLQTAQKRAKLN